VEDKMKEFDKWYSNYPHKCGRPTSEEAWKAALHWVLSNKRIIIEDDYSLEYPVDIEIIYAKVIENELRNRPRQGKIS
jgi:hypothetical protein